MSASLAWIVEHRTDIDTDQGQEAMRRVEALLGPSPTPAARGAATLARAVSVGWADGRTEDAIALAAEAEELFDAAGDVPGRLLATNEIGYLHWRAGDFAGFSVIADGVLAAAEEAGDRFALLQALSSVSHCRQLGGDLVGSLAALDRAIDLARTDGRAERIRTLLAQSAYSQALLGRTEAAADGLREAGPSDYDAPVAWLAGRLSAVGQGAGWPGAAIAAAEQGDLATAQRILESSGSSGSSGAETRWAAGVVASLRGDRTGALEHLTAGLRRQQAGGCGGGPLARFMLADLGELAADADDPAVTALVYEFTPASDIDACGLPLAGLSRFAGAAADIDEAAAEAAADLVAVADLFGEAGWRVLAGRALALAGRAAAVAGHRDDAVKWLSEAAGQFDVCGAVVRREAVLGELRRLGA
jgi:tetratricopeptide (TPR) repeat protein